MQFIGMCLGTTALYVIGTFWLAHIAGLTFGEALTAGALPFIPGDIVKMIAAIALGRTLNRRLSPIILK